jgi:hypothetical protein
MNFIDLGGQEIQYTKTCRDYRRVCECCEECHADPAAQLDIIKVDGEVALLCCKMRNHFYPDGYPHETLWNLASPEERLLRAIFGEKVNHQK